MTNKELAAEIDRLLNLAGATSNEEAQSVYLEQVGLVVEENYKAIIAALDGEEWVKCDESVHDLTDWVLIAYRGEVRQARCQWDDYHRHYYWESMYEDLELKDVTHWRPLPKPPEKE